MQLRPEWPWIFRSLCTYLHPYHIYLHVSILSLSLPHISLCFLCIIFITAIYILYFITTTMIVTESEVFKVHPGAFPNSLSAVQLRDWLSQGCKIIFSLSYTNIHTANLCSEIAVKVQSKDCNLVWSAVSHCMQWLTVIIWIT